LLLAHAGALLLYLPWLPFAEANAPNLVIGVLSGGFSFDQLFEYPARVLVGYAYQNVVDVPGWPLLLAASAVVAVVAGIALRDRPLELPRPNSPVWLLVATALAAPAGTLLYSALKEYIFSPRYLLVSAPAALVLLSGLIGRRSTAVAVPATAALVAILGITSVRTAFGDLRRPAYDKAGALIDREAGPRDPVIEYPNLVFLVEPPLNNPIQPFFDRPHPHVGGQVDAARGWRAALRSGHAFVVFTTTANRLEDVGDPRFAAVERHSWPRKLGDLTVVEYALEDK
jgi:hypothetical protein